jgi:hypothetical protein
MKVQKAHEDKIVEQMLRERGKSMDKFEELKGKTLTQISVNEDEDDITFLTACGKIYHLFHEQDCCEIVGLEDICGELKNLIDSPVLVAEERSEESRCDKGSVTWTFYEISTLKGSVTIRWHGESNGYYSESVTFERMR